MINFLKEFLTNPKAIGAVKPSSSHLAEAMTNVEALGSSKCVVELGSGTGAITEKIMGKISRNCIFFALETNLQFVQVTKEKCPDATVYADSALRIKKYLKKHKVEYCDTIVSSLPWTFFDKETQHQLLDALSQSLSPEGKLTTYFYTITPFPLAGRRVKKYLQQHFSHVEKKIVWKNIPPAIVYECRK